MKNRHTLPFIAGQFIVKLFTKELSPDLLFHNFYHTANVVQGVRQISKYLAVSDEETEILLLAAWFHDAGFTRVYKGHEKESINIARDFLTKFGYPEDRQEQVFACIAATEMPQNPTDDLHKIICDADMFHLSLPEYYYLQRLLLEEWRRVLKKGTTEEEWMDENLLFLREHRYFTQYGQEVLQREKEWNITKFIMLSEDND